MSTNEKYIVLLGETGSGKSTFINYLANYFNAGKVSNLKVAIPTRFHAANMNFRHEEQFVSDVTISKTINCQHYTFDLEDMKFHFIDTPGINDTGGFVQDSQNIKKIFGYIEKLPEIAALVLIMNGAVSRATINISNVLSTLQQHIPDIVYNNMLIVLTNCQPHTISFCPSDLGLPTESSVFHMQNSAFSSDSYLWSEETRNIMKQDFRKSMNTINQLIVEILKLQPQSTAKFKDLQDDRYSIKRELHDVRMMLMDLQRLEDELISYEVSANIHSTNVEKFRNFVQTKTITQFKRIPVNYHSTTCSMCNNVCHEKCGLNEVPLTGNKIFFNCVAMVQGVCRVCGCHATSHYHDRSVIRPVTCTIQETVSGLKERYHEAKAGKEKADVECSNIEGTKKIVEHELKLQYNKVKESIVRLQQTCSGVNVSAELYDFIVSLKKDVGTLRATSVVNKTNTFIAELEQLCKNMENTEIRTTVNDGHRQQLPRPLVSRKFVYESGRKTFVPQTSINSDASRSKYAVTKPTVLLETESNKVVTDIINPSFSTVVETEQLSNMQVQNGGSDVNKFVHANKQIIASQSMLDSSSEQKVKGAIPEIGTETEDEVNFAAFNLSDLIKASKRIQNKRIRKELDNRCRGKSLGLLSNAQQMQLCKHFAGFQSKTLREVTLKREELEERIQEEISYDPFNIDKVPEAILLELAAVNLVIFADPPNTSV